MRGDRSRQALELWLDGRFYVAAPGAFVSVQDENGLLSLNSLEDAPLAALLEQTGVHRGEASRMAAALGDYIDADDLVRPDGAERRAYRRADLPDPANRSLSERWQALDVLGWRTPFDDTTADALWNLVSARNADANVNLNTAPRMVLAALLGQEQAADAIISRRESAELRSADEVTGLTSRNSRVAGVTFTTQPGAAFRIVIAFGETAGAAREAYESQLVLAEPDAERPFYWRESRVRRVDALNGRDVEIVEYLPGSPELRSP
jgi:hypothetical protein